MITIDEIYNNLKQSYETESGLVLNDGGDMALRFYAVAAELVSLWAQCDYVNRQCFPQTATGEWLDKHAAMRGLCRAAAVKAQGSIRFYITAARSRDVFIPSGTRCMTASLAEFATTADTFIRAGDLYCDAPAEAISAGGQGNAAAGEVNIMQNAPVGVSRASNPLPFTGGKDSESDEALRERVLKSYGAIANGGNIAYYEMLAKNVAGVSVVKVLPKERGRGTVDIIITSDSGMPTSELIDRVSAAVEERREISADVLVKAPDSTEVDVYAIVCVEQGYSVENVLANVRNAITAHFNGELLGKSVYCAELSNIIYSVPGVYNYRLIFPPTDVSIGESGLAVLRNLDIREA